jgi:hypothetical protein
VTEPILVAGNSLIYLYDSMRRCCRDVEQEIQYRKRDRVVDAYTIKIEQLNAEMKTTFDANRPARRVSISTNSSATT